MSYRSVLSNPLTASGSVGTVVTGANPATAISLTTTVSAPIDSVNLSEGVWSVQVSALAVLAGATASTLNFSLATGATVYFITSVVEQTSTLTANLASSHSVIISLSAPAVVTLSAIATFSAGTVSIDNPSTTSTQYLVATKLA